MQTVLVQQTATPALLGTPGMEVPVPAQEDVQPANQQYFQTTHALLATQQPVLPAVLLTISLISHVYLVLDNALPVLMDPPASTAMASSS